MEHFVKSNNSELQLETNLVRIRQPAKRGVCKSILIRLVLGVLLLGVGVVAVYYSINIHSDSNNEDSNSLMVFYTLRNVQSCSTGGVITREILKSFDSNGVVVHKTVKVSSEWIQDEDKSRLYYSIGTQNKSDWEKSFYFFSDHGLLIDKTGCCRHSFNYTSFIDSFGLSSLMFMRSENIIMPNAENYVSVNLFQGEPIAHSNFSQNPFLAFAYMDTSYSLNYAWQLYYSNNVTNSISFWEHWYPNMKHVETNANIFINIPDSCFPPKQCTTTLQAALIS